MTGEQFDAMIARMALAICNVIRKRHGEPPLVNMLRVQDADFYIEQARAAYLAQADKN